MATRSGPSAGTWGEVMVREARIDCPSCGRVIRIDAEKLPARAVAFRCPGCRAKVVADRSRLGMSAPAGSDPEPDPVTARTSEAPPEQPAGSPEPPPAEVELPPGAELPPGLVVTRSAATAGQISAVLHGHGSSLVEVADGEEARQWIRDHGVPRLVVWAADTVGDPPLDDMRPLLSLMPSDRRHAFVVLVASNLKSQDGLAAFLYQVNLVIASRDVAGAAGIIYAALDEHRRLYRPLLAAIEARRA